MTARTLDDETLAKLNSIRSPALRFAYMLFKAWTTPQRLCSACKPTARLRSPASRTASDKRHATAPGFAQVGNNLPL